jgi:hypothetical protein
VVRSCTLSGNSAGGSGGALQGAFIVSDSTLTGNSARYFGGGINGIATITNCTLSGNFAVEGGGGVFVVQFGGLAISDSTLTGNSAGEGGGIGNFFDSPAAVIGCTLSGNSAVGNVGEFTSGPGVLAGNGGGILNTGTMTVTGCTVTGNSANASGGGIYNGTLGGILPGALTIDQNSGVFGNQAPIGADLENVGDGPGTVNEVSIVQSAVAALDNQNQGVTTINVAASDTATALTPYIDPATGQIAFEIRVLAAQAGAAMPTAAVVLYDGNNNVLGTAQLDTSGQASFTAPDILGSPSPIYAVYSGDGTFTSSTSAPLIQAVNALTSGNVQGMLNSLASSPSTAVALDASDTADAQTDANVIATVMAPSISGTPVPVTVVLRLAQGTYHDLTLSTQDNVTLVVVGGGMVGTVNGTTVVGNSPAVVVTRGNVTLANLSLTTATDAPTIVVSGGHLTLRNDVVQESTGYSDAAIAVSGGSTLDLGTAASPGGNTINVNGAGQTVSSTGVNLVTAVGNTLQVNGSAVFPVATIALASSVNPALLSQPVTFTATVSAPGSGTAVPAGHVTFMYTTTGMTLGVVPLSSGMARLTTSTLPVNAQTIAAVYSGDAHYITSAATLVQRVDYHFGGFLPPLNSSLAFGAGRTVPIKFQLTDYNGAYITSLSAIESLLVAGPSGTIALTGSLRYDPTSNQYVVNWQTKGLPVGTYTIALALADGTTYQKVLTLNASGSGANAQAVNGSDTSGGGTADTLLAGDLAMFINDPSGDFTPDELARIQDAINAWDAVLSPYSVTINEISDPTLANIVIDAGTTSACGGAANGVLGCYNEPNAEITMIQGWNWYAGSDPSQIGPGQYDFETTVLHELGHALGLGGSTDPGSPMFETLAPGTTHRIVSTQDLNIPDPPDGADPLSALGFAKATLPAAPLAVSITAAVPVASAPLTVFVMVPVTGVASPASAPSPASGSHGVLPAIGARPIQRLSTITAVGTRASWIDRTIDENRAPGLDGFADPDDLPREDGPAVVQTTPIISQSLLRSWDGAIEAYVAEGDAPARAAEVVAQSPAVATDPTLSPLESTLWAGAAVALWGAWELRPRKDDRRRP